MERRGRRRAGLTPARALVAVLTGAADSRRGLEEALGVSKATACRMVDRLLEGGELVEGPTLRTPGPGRSTASLQVRADLGYLVGTDLEGLALRTCVFDAQRSVLASRRREVPPRASMRRILDDWRELIGETVAEADVPRSRVVALGVALPGMAAVGDDAVRTYLPPGRLVHFDVHEALGALDLPIVASDNTLCVADYERRLGVARDAPSFVSVLVRYGIGAALCSGGRFVVGEELLCAELGHLVVERGGPACVCGRRGCLDAFCSGRTWPPESERHGPAWRADLEERARWLGIGLGNLLKLVHSPLVILNGVYDRHEETVRPRLVASLAEELEPLGLAVPELRFGTPLEEKACIGAALRGAERRMARHLARHDDGRATGTGGA